MKWTLLVLISLTLSYCYVRGRMFEDEYHREEVVRRYCEQMGWDYGNLSMAQQDQAEAIAGIKGGSLLDKLNRRGDRTREKIRAGRQ
jgi:hypothetical protein